MSIQFKITEAATTAKRDALLAALAEAGFRAAPLFPNQKRPALALIYTISGASDDDLANVRAALRPFAKAIDFIEGAPKRHLKR